MRYWALYGPLGLSNFNGCFIHYFGLLEVWISVYFYVFCSLKSQCITSFKKFESPYNLLRIWKHDDVFLLHFSIVGDRLLRIILPAPNHCESLTFCCPWRSVIISYFHYCNSKLTRLQAATKRGEDGGQCIINHEFVFWHGCPAVWYCGRNSNQASVGWRRGDFKSI